MKPLQLHIPRTFLLLAVSVLAFAACKKDAGEGTANPKADKLDPARAAGGDVLTLTGSDLAQMRSITFSNGEVPAPFNPNFNTTNAVIFRVPDTANGGKQDITLTNVAGKQIKVEIEVVALPRITSASNYVFTEGDTIAFTGRNFEAVSSVKLAGTTTEATIISKDLRSMVIKMPAITTPRTKLEITNPYGTVTTSDEFISIANNLGIFTDDFGTFGWGVQNWSWSCDVAASTEFAKNGARSLKVTYHGGGLSLFLGNEVFNPMTSGYQYLVFSTKGGTAETEVEIKPDSGPGSGSTKVKIPAEVWTFHKIPLGFITGDFGRVNFILNVSGQTIFYDNILFVK